ncbi:MAG: hypothetical protein JST60_01255 [Chloroflexi bacterium SZAS-1]|nr:hypothetical protein [Chloroflexi bacterium SZAS-1]
MTSALTLRHNPVRYQHIAEWEEDDIANINGSGTEFNLQPGSTANQWAHACAARRDPGGNLAAAVVFKRHAAGLVLPPTSQINHAAPQTIG